MNLVASKESAVNVGAPCWFRYRYRCRSRQPCASFTGAFDAGSGSRPRIMSAAFSPIMIVGALRLPEVIDGMIEEVDDAQPLDPDHPRLGVDHGHRIVARRPSCRRRKGDRRSRVFRAGKRRSRRRFGEPSPGWISRPT